MKKWIIGLALIVALPAMAHAQANQSQACNVGQVTPANAGADITVDATAGGVNVIAATTRGTCCGGIIQNTSANAMRCAATGDQTVTSSVGFYIPANGSFILGAECYLAWNCIRTGGSSATASVFIEGLGQAR